MKKTETYLKRFFLLFFLPIIWTFSIHGQCDRSKDSINLVKLHESLDGINWTYEETQLDINSFAPPNLPNAGKPWNTNTPIDQWHGIALDGNGCVTMIALHNNNLTGELPDFLNEFTQLEALNIGYNQLTGTIPASLGTLEHLTKFHINWNDIEGCIPDELNVCAKGFSQSFERDGYNFTQNMKLPNYGSFSRLCTWGVQIDEPCDDGDSESARDLIREDCSCRGIYCKITDSLELLKLFDATNGNEWSFDKSTYETKLGIQDIPNPLNRWSVDVPMTNWHGIVLNLNGCVIGIYLSDNNLSNELPELKLPFLSTLVVSNNELSGSLPNFSKTPDLFVLDCSFNQFEGSLPSEFPPYLRYLDISDNQFNSTLPDIDKLGNLYNLYCSNSQLKGNIPSVDSENYTFEHFDCSGNQFTGKIPLMTGARKLAHFNCSKNKLTGNIPPFVDLSYLKYFNCSDNKLDGKVLVNESAKFSHFYCQNNELNGQLPDFQGNSELIDFDCSNNSLSGKLPNFNLYRIKNFDCSNNQFDDGLPNILASFILKKFDCSNNKFNGAFPEFRNAIRLEEFNCSGNQISGNLPEFDQFIKLRIFDCSKNRLSGRIPYLTNVPDLEVFNCSSNLIGRSIPSLDSLSNLRIFDCSNNNISETLPEFNNNPNLEEFDCSNNLFMTGNIPDLSLLPNLIHFNCATNQLTGELPSLLKNKQLKSFIFSNNNITGKLHYSIERLDSLERFYGFNNQLEGCIPLNFNKLCSLGNSTSTDSIGYNLSLNPMLPWFGDLRPFCDNEPQLDQPCDDGNPDTHNDIIQTDCSCEGTISSSISNINSSPFQLFPNPTTGMINLPSIDFKKINLYNSSGQRLPIEISSTLDISHLPSGIYYLKFQTADNIFLKKVVKK